MKKISIVCLLVLVLACAFTVVCVEAKPTLSISFYKDNGYSMGDDMNGDWTINTEVSSDVEYVEFFVDDELQLSDTSAPFSWSFNTGDYTEGAHTLQVIAYDAQGETATADREANFVGFPLTFVVGIIVLTVVVLIVSFGFALYRARKNEKERQHN